MASYSTDVSEAAWALIQPHLSQDPRTAALNGPAPRGERHLLPFADGLSVAAAAPLLPALGARSITISASGWERACG
jgi:hypothetical protein